jgi:hypothetical protein
MVRTKTLFFSPYPKALPFSPLFVMQGRDSLVFQVLISERGKAVAVLEIHASSAGTCRIFCAS